LKSLHHHIYFLASIVALTSCVKEENIFIPDESPRVDISALHQYCTEGSSYYKLEIKEDHDLVFKHPSGLYLLVPQGSLVTSDGKEVVGSVILYMEDLLDEKSDLLISPSTIVDGRLEKSVALFDFGFSQGGKLVKLSKPMDIYCPYSGDGYPHASVYTTGAWTDVPLGWTTGSWSLSNGEQISQVEGIKIQIQQVSKVAVFERPKIGIYKPSTICASSVSNDADNNEIAYYRSESGKSYITLSSGAVHCSGKVDYVVPENGHIIIISNNANNTYNLGITSITVDGNVEKTVELKTVNLETLKAALASL
jgi:hypothetical protein